MEMKPTIKLKCFDKEKPFFCLYMVGSSLKISINIVRNPLCPLYEDILKIYNGYCFRHGTYSSAKGKGLQPLTLTPTSHILK